MTTLLVVPKVTRADEVNACIKSPYLWSSVQKIRLTTNVRMQLSDGDVEKNLLKGVVGRWKCHFDR